ncbi:hypothetical protein C8J55DRAFT_489515 [Lentinula edodes]|uniref:Uncharacterized protein n=1 Tax=Lentinula lateritia TaxID=40482 RepID=A0A9W9ACB5_9AGAR|nr:hypothetical protein C8J55DRAFT_489515 [Lentinula edodes]
MYLDELQQQLEEQRGTQTTCVAIEQYDFKRAQLRNLSSWRKAHLRDGHHGVAVVGLFVEDGFKKLSLRGVAATPLSLHFLSMEYSMQFSSHVWGPSTSIAWVAPFEIQLWGILRMPYGLSMH